MKKISHTGFIAIAAGFLTLLFIAKDNLYQDDKSSSNEINKTPVQQPLISPEEAKMIACNNLQTTKTGVKLSHPNHQMTFEKEGVLFQPRKGPSWQWQLTHIGTEEESLNAIVPQSIQPENKKTRIIEYDYGNVIEQYHAKSETVEQRFVIPDPLPLNNQDLFIKGQVKCEGTFKSLENGFGWVWEDHDGKVALGDVTVFDAQGKTLMAHMEVTAQETKIVVDADGLATASYPVTVDPEIGANDFRISDMGVDGDIFSRAADPKVVYNSANNEYLVVWSGDDNDGVGPLVDNEFEIFGQRINALNGAEIGTNDFRISNMGPDGNQEFDAGSPDIAYNPNSNQYLVVWTGDDGAGPLVNNEREIFGQLLSANGSPIGPNDFRISDMGPNQNVLFSARSPAVVYNSNDDEYLVVWDGDDTVNDEFEIYGQRLDAATGTEVGPNDFQISNIGPNGDSNFLVSDPEVAYDFDNNQYLVVWRGAFNNAGFLINEFEIFGQLLDSSGSEIGTDDFRISDMGVDGDTDFDALGAEIAYNNTNQEYLVAWHGDDNVNDEFEIYCQRIDALTGAEIGLNDFRISDMGPDGNADFDASFPNIAYNSINNQYLVTWRGDDNTPPLVDEEDEVFGQILDAATGAEIGIDFRISDAGPDGNPAFTVFFTPNIAYNFIRDQYLVVWSAEDLNVNGELEIFGQRLLGKKSLVEDTDQVSIANGGVQNLSIDVGPQFGGFIYFTLGSLSGTSPGIPLNNGMVIPLNFDVYFTLTLTNPNGLTLPAGFGILDAAGRANTQFNLPAGLLNQTAAGTIVNHAVVVIDPSTSGLPQVTNAVSCRLVP